MDDLSHLFGLKLPELAHGHLRLVPIFEASSVKKWKIGPLSRAFHCDLSSATAVGQRPPPHRSYSLTISSTENVALSTVDAHHNQMKRQSS